MAEEVDGAFSVSVTVTVRVMPPPVIVMVPELVPIVAVVVLTPTDRDPLLDPDVGLTDSQLMPSLTVQEVLDVTASV